MSLGLILRDIDLAAANNVNGTPTLFINGHRLQGVKDAKELREMIDAAAAEGDGIKTTATAKDPHRPLSDADIVFESN